MIRKIFAFLALVGLAALPSFGAAEKTANYKDKPYTINNAITKAASDLKNNEDLGIITVFANCETASGASKLEFSINSGVTLTLAGGEYDGNTFGGEGNLVITGGTFDFDPSSKLPTGYETKEDPAGTWTVSVSSSHQHNWSYAPADGGAALTATCDVSGCPTPQVKVSIAATGKTYDGKPVTAKLTDEEKFGNATGLTVGGIVYKDRAGATLDAAPSDAGDYTAEVQVGTYTISVAFAIAPIDITGATVTLDATSFKFSGAEQSVSVVSVKQNETTLKAGDYEPDAASVSAATKPGTYTVIVKGKGNYTGSASATWTIVGPTGKFGQVMTTTAGWTVEGTTNRVTDSTKLVCKDGKWTMSMAVEIPHPNQSLGVYLVHPDPLLHFDALNSVALSGSPILSGSYIGKTDIKSFTWTEGFTLEEIQAAEAEGVLRKTLTVYEPVYSETVTFVGTLHNNGGLRETTFVMEVPLEGLVLIDGEGNQAYPDAGYIAENGTTHKKYLTLAAALADAAGQTVEVFADAAAEGELIVPVGATLNLGSHGHAESTYVLTGTELDFSAKVISTKEETVSARGEGVADDFFKAVKADDSCTYTLELRHKHIFGYEPDDAAGTITVTCSDEGECAYKTTPSVATLKADSLVYTGEAYVGARAEKSDNFPAEVTLTYFKNEMPLGDALAGAPTDAGEYVVRMSAGGQSVEKTFTIVQAQLSALNLKTAVFSYDGTEKTAEIESVKAGENGAFTLKPEEYEVSGDALTQVGSLAETKSYSVVVTAKAGGNYTGSVQMNWKIEAPSGAFAGMTTSAAGCAVSGEDGTVVIVTDSRELKYDATAKAWKFSLTVTLPKDSKDIYNVNPASLVYFTGAGIADPLAATATEALGERGISLVRAGVSNITLGDHRGEMDVGSFTWTGSFTLEEVEAVLRQNGVPTLTKSLAVYELAYSENIVIGTMHNGGGIKSTTFSFELPIDEALVLLDEDLNQVYPHVDFVAQVGKTKYASLDAALAAAAETAGVSKTNVVTVIGTVTNGSYAVGRFVKLELGAYGADSTYVLGADAVLTADAVLANVSAASGSELMSAGDSPVTYWTIKAHEHVYSHTAQGAVLTEFCTAQLKDGSPCGVTNLCTLGDASKAYDGEAPFATVADKLDAKHTTGKVLYLNTDRSKVSVWNVGTYLSVVTVSVDSVGYELSREFTVLPADLKDATVTLSATEFAYNGKDQTVSVKSVKIGDLTLTKDTHYTVDGTLTETGLFNGTQEYTITITAVAGGNFTGSKTVTWKIVSKPRDFDAVTKNNAAGNASYDEKNRTLTVSDGTGWQYYTADKAPDGSGIEGWYAGLKVSWPSDINIDLSGFKLLYTRPEAARFTVNAIKTGGGEEKRIFNGTNSIPGVMVNTLPIDLSAIVQGLDLTCVTSFTWWERLTIADLEAAKSAGRKTIERTVTAWGEVWSDTFKAGLIFQTEREYGDPDGVRPTTYKLVANLEGLTLYDNEGLAWPQHEHKWEYVANDTSVTATCAIAGCRYEKSPAGVTLSADPAERLCNGLPLAATLANAETFRGVTKSEVSGILYTGTDYTGAAYESAEAPVQPGNYRAEAAVTLADGTTYEIGLALTIREGLVVVDGQHYESPAEVLEMPGSDVVKVSVWKDFKAEKTYVMPANGTKVLDLCGKTISAPDGQENVITNLGALTIIDSAVTPQEAAKGTYRGKLYGDIVNTGTLTITGGYIAGTIVNAGGTVLLSGGVFKVRPDAKWLADGCKIVTRSGLYYVEGHLHQYVLVRSLGGSLVFATCMNILADGTLQASECDAREVIFLLSPMKGLLAGAVSVPTTSLEYDGRPKTVELTAFNLWALRELIRIPSLADLGETWELIQKVIKLTQGGGSITDGAEVLTEILEALAERGFNPADFVLSADAVAALTGIKAGTVAYTCGGVPVEGVPVNAGTYRATMTLTGGDGRSQTIASTYTINPTDIATANPNITCDPKGRTFQYDQDEKVISVTSVALDSPATVQIRKFLAAAQEFMSKPKPDWNGAMNLLSMLNDLAVDLPQPPDFWRDYGILRALDFVADFMAYLTNDVIEYLKYEISAVTLEEGIDYTVGGTTAATEIGAYVLTVDGMGNYKGAIPVDWTISYDHDGKGHNWAFALDRAKLTATCQTSRSCLISPAVIELVPDTVTEKAYDGAPLTASLSNAFLFATYTGATNIGAVCYRDADGAALASAPVAVGEYWASADVEIAPGTTNTLKLALAITIPEGGFTDGYEVRTSDAEYGVRYDTLAQALAAAKTGDTIFAHSEIIGKDLDFTTDADVTIDLCGKTLTASPTSTLLGNNNMTLANASAGTVTFVNGTIRQPRHYILGRQNADQMSIASGNFVFGKDLALVNVATSSGNYFTVTVAEGASLEVADGKYDAKFAGDVTITGGSFWSSFDPTPFLPEGRITRPDPADASRKIVVEHWHNVVATVEGDDTISMTCTAEGDCDLKTPATATLSIAAETEFNNEPVRATVTTVGLIGTTLTYFEGAEELPDAPKYVGEYTVVMSVGEVAVTSEFKITKPTGGYADGFEVGGVRYDTLAEALDAAEEGETIYVREDLNAAVIDFTSEKDLTVDLCGQTLTYERSQAAASDLTIRNDGAGIVTLKNGTIVQPRGQSRQTIFSPWQNVYYNVNVTGPFVFGEDMETEKRGTAFTVTANALAITDGVYESAFAGELVITGGTFASDPGEFVPEGYMAVEDEGVWVVINHTHAYAYAAEGQRIVRTCVGGEAPCPDAPVSIELSVAAETAYTGNPVAATVTPSDAFDHALAYFADGEPLDGAPTDAGEYTVVMSAGNASVTNGFAITPVALTSLALDEESFVFDGAPKTNAVVEVRAGAFTLTADDYTLAGDGLVQTGSLFSDTTYMVIVRGTGNFTGAATNTWAILASTGAFEAWRNLYFRADLADFGLDIPLSAKAVKAEGLPAGLKLVKTAVKDATGKTTVGYRYAIEGVPTELMDNKTRPVYVRVTDVAGVQTLWPLVFRVSEPEPGTNVEGTVGNSTLVVGGESDTLFRVTKIWRDAEVGWTYAGWPSGITYDKNTGHFSGTPKKAGRYTLTATSGKVGSTTYKNVRTATFTVWADADGELSELTGQAYVAQTNGMDRFGAVKSVTGLPTGLKFTAKDVTDKTYGAIPPNTVYGLPTKAGTFVVTLTLADKSKKSLLWTIAPAVAPACEVVLGDAVDTPVERRRAQLVQGSVRRYEIATSDPKATVTASGLPSGLTLKKTAVKDAAGKAAGYTYAIEGVPTAVGEFFVTVKTTLNGVTTVSSLAFTVNENPFTGLYKGLTALDGRIGAAELSAAAGGTVKLTLKEGKTTYSANVKSFEWNGTDESGHAVFLLKANSADKKAGFPDREIEALMLSDGTATVCDVLSPGETCELFRTVKPTAEEMPSFTATYRFAKESGGPLAVLAVIYDAKKATASVKGKLADGTSVSMASIAVLSNGFLAPVQAVDKSGTAWVFDRLGFDGSAAVGSMSRMGEETVETVTTYGSDVTANPKPKFGEVVTEETTLGFAFGNETESFRLVPNGKGGVAVYEEGTANPLLTVSSAFANGLLSFSFTSKTGDKAKYAVDLVLEAESLPSGQVLRTWKDGSTSLSSAGVALLTVQP